MKISKEESVAIDIWTKINPGYKMQKSECPDWVDYKESVGVEVVSTEPKNVCQQRSFCFQSVGTDIAAIPKESIEALSENGFHLITAERDSDGNKVGTVTGCVRIFDNREKETLFEAIKKKMEKSGYQTLKRLDLFVFARQYPKDSFDVEDCKRVFLCEQECGPTLHNRFDTIYIDFYETIYVFDTHTRLCKVLEWRED